MGLRALSSRWRSRPRRHPVDDAYTTWLGAHMHCTDAMRAWWSAAPGHRAIAYQVYRARLEREERAAAELERLHAVPAAA